MKKQLILLITFILFTNRAYLQSQLDQQIQQDFINEYCDCLQQHAELENEELLINQTVVCIKDFFAKNTESVEKAVKSSNIEAASDYEKGSIYGRKMIFRAINDLVNDCAPYRTTLYEYKSMMIEQTGTNNENVKEMLIRFEEALPTMNSNKEKSSTYTLIGVLYEFDRNNKKAEDNYEKALKLYPSTQAKGLLQLLRKTTD